MNYIRKHLNTIIISFAIGIILFYIQPTLDYLGKKVVEFFIFTSDKFSELYYTMVAQNNPYLFEELNNYILTMGFLFLTTHLFTDIKRKRYELRKRTSENLEKLRELKEKVSDQDDKHQKHEEQDKTKTLEKLEQLESNSKLLLALLEKRNNTILAMGILIPFTGLILLSNYVLNRTVTKENVDFRNDTIMLLPYMGQIEINSINSSWAQMRNASDYDQIINKIEKAKEKYLKK